MDEAAMIDAAVIDEIALGLDKLYKDESAAEKFIKVESVTKSNPENHEKYVKMMSLFERSMRCRFRFTN